MISCLPMCSGRIITGSRRICCASYQDAVEMVGRIVDETYRETGGFDVKTYLREKEDRLRKKR